MISAGTRLAYKRFRRDFPDMPGQEALLYARDLVRGYEAGLNVEWSDEDHPWDGDCEAPAVHAWAGCYLLGGDRFAISSLGGIGLLSWDDPYMRIVESELYAEALEVLAAEADQAAEEGASELAARPTYAGVAT